MYPLMKSIWNHSLPAHPLIQLPPGGFSVELNVLPIHRLRE
jgi:hypothetical protein